jgi:hypothetical protein
MKIYSILIISLCFLLLSSCKKKDDETSTVIVEPPVEEITACGITDPAKNIPWLTEFIATAQNDTTANYLGIIWLEKYQDQDVFVINMSLGDETITWYFRDCKGNDIVFEDIDKKKEFFYNLKKDIVIYTKPIIACGITDPARNLPWLVELIKKMNFDSNFLYAGRIYLENFKGQDIFVSTLSFGGAANWYFDCDGNHFVFWENVEDCAACRFLENKHFYMKDPDFEFFRQSMKKDIIIYSPFERFLY